MNKEDGKFKKGNHYSSKTEFKKGFIPWNLGKLGYKTKPAREETKKKIGLANKGKKRSEETKELLRKIHLGKHFSEETKRKMSKLHKGKNHWNWKGGLTSIAFQIRNNFKMRQWRSDVFERDNFICQNCYERGGNLEAHHIKSFALILKENNIKTFEEALACEELWNVNNGQTLCKECHKKTDNYSNKKI